MMPRVLMAHAALNERVRAGDPFGPYAPGGRVLDAELLELVRAHRRRTDPRPADWVRG